MATNIMNFKSETEIFPSITLLKIAGHWPLSNAKLYTILKHYIAISCILYNLTSFIDIVTKESTVEMLAMGSYQLICTVANVVKFLLFRQKLDVAQNLVGLLKIKRFHPATEKQENVLKLRIFQSKAIFYFYAAFGTATMILWNIAPIFQNDKKLPTDAWFPFDYKRCYAWTYVWQAATLFHMSWSNLALDTLFPALALVVIAHCEILDENIKNLGSGIDDDARDLLRDVQGCIQYHKFILTTSNLLGISFRSIILTQFFTSSVVICTTMFVFTLTNPFSITGLFLTAYLLILCTELLMYCWFGNEITLKSEQLSRSIFESNWYDCPKSVQNDLRFFMHRTQTPVTLYVAGILPTNLGTYMRIIKSSCSYFMALRSVHNRN